MTEAPNIAGGVGGRLDDLERLLVGGEQHAVALDAARRADRLAMAVLQVDRGARLQQLVVSPTNPDLHVLERGHGGLR